MGTRAPLNFGTIQKIVSDKKAPKSTKTSKK